MVDPHPVIPPPSAEARADVWLWSVRVYKTRSLAATACRKGAVVIGETKIKPSRLVRTGDRVEIRKPFLNVVLEVKGVPAGRVSPKLVDEFRADLTPPEQVALARELSEAVRQAPRRPAGQGRPTKRDRRQLERLEEGDGTDDKG